MRIWSQDRTAGGDLAAFVRAFVADARWRAGLALALVAAGAMIEGLSILMIVPILGVVIGQTALPAWLPGAAWVMALHPLARLGLLLAAFVAVMAVRGGLLHARDLLLTRLQLGFIERQRNAVMNALAAAPWSRVALLDHAAVTNLMGSEIGRVASTAHFVVQALVAAVMLAIQLGIATLLSWPLAAGAAVVLAIGLGLTLLRARRMRDMGGDVVRSSQAMMGSTSAFLGGLKAAAAEGATARFVREFAHVQQQLRTTQIRFASTQATTRLRFALGSAIAASIVVFTGVATATPASALITLILLFSRMGGPALQVAQSVQTIQFGLPSFAAIRAMLDALGEGKNEAVTPVAPPDGPIVLEGATHLHPAGGGIQGANLTIAPGSFVGIVGPSGAGKTSLVDLIAGLVPPGEGRVSVGGVPLDAAHRAGWRLGVAYVPQDGFLFHDSVARNLDGDGWADPAEVARALALTGADRVVSTLPEGLATIVGERGARLSGGERQRLAIARALLRRPRLMVLDEATNAIDIAGEDELLAALAGLSPRPTILMVAHRVESLSYCDRVVRVEGGRIVEEEPVNAGR